MARHPVTPMGEADLRLHLAKQTDKTIGLVDLAMLAGDDVDESVDALFSQGAEIVLFDVADMATQRSVGRQLVRMRGDRGAFVVGSSGVEYALLAEWERAGPITGAPQLFRAWPGRSHRRRIGQLLARPPSGRFAMRRRMDSKPMRSIRSALQRASGSR